MANKHLALLLFMLRTLKLTFYSSIISWAAMFFTYLLVDFGRDPVAVIFYAFGNILIPTLVGVLIFKLIDQKTMLTRQNLTIILQIIILTILFLTCIYLWATLETFISNDLSFKSVQEDFNREFREWLPAIFTTAIALPILNKKLN